MVKLKYFIWCVVLDDGLIVVEVIIFLNSYFLERDRDFFGERKRFLRRWYCVEWLLYCLKYDKNGDNVLVIIVI